MLDLKRLRVLRAVAEHGSFSAAAEALFVSQSAISQQIAALEAECGTSLLMRLRSGPVLTDAGELLVSHADAAIARLEQAERELAELAGLKTGEVRVASFPSASGTLVVDAASSFRERYPEVRLSIAEGEPETSIPELKKGRHDIAVVYDFELTPFAADRDLALVPLLTEQMHVIVPADHRLADRAATGIRLSELEAEPWLCGASDGSCRQLTLQSCELAGFEPEVSFESNDYTVLQSLVAAGMGVTLLPDLALSSLHPGVTVIPVIPEAPVRRVWAATLEAGSRSTATEAMLDVLVEAGRRRAPAAVAA